MIIDVWRMSASRPWQLEKTHPALIEHLKFSGELRFHLIESVLVREYSDQCIEWGKANGYEVYTICPARGQGYAIDYALKNIITSKYALKWEDDMRPEKDIPLDECVEVMEAYPHINQICFNKRETMTEKLITMDDGVVRGWPKEQRCFKVGDKDIHLVCKEKWWFGPALWRVDFIRPIFKYWGSNTHNLFNDEVLMPRSGYKHGNPAQGWKGRHVPTASEIEKTIGCYIWGKHEDPRMVEHTGAGDSIWSGEYQEMMRKEGKQIIGK